MRVCRLYPDLGSEHEKDALSALANTMAPLRWASGCAAHSSSACLFVTTRARTGRSSPLVNLESGHGGAVCECRVVLYVVVYVVMVVCVQFLCSWSKCDPHTGVRTICGDSDVEYRLPFLSTPGYKFPAIRNAVGSTANNASRDFARAAANTASARSVPPRGWNVTMGAGQIPTGWTESALASGCGPSRRWRCER